MKLRMRIMRVGLILSVLMLPAGTPSYAHADQTAASLVFREVKITGDEFIVIENSGAIESQSLDNYWLGYTGDDQAPAVPTQQLPADMTLQPGQSLLLTYGTTQTCDAVAVAKLATSLSDSKGTLSLWQASNTGYSMLPNTKVRWINKAGDDINTANDTNLTKANPDANAVWYKDVANASSTWQLGDFQACNLNIPASVSGGAGGSISWPQSDVEPPAIIESVANTDLTSNATLPASDMGLQPPQITELLPNPAGSGNDASDEFIELYNPNNANFDLSGFTLQTGLTTKHSYVFPGGTILPSKGFVAFYSADTGLSLSNTSGQADLLDPFGKTITESDAYGSAKDGQTWALANSKWYWTAQATPNAANVVKQIVTASKTTGLSSSKKASSAVKGAATTAASGSATNSMAANATISAPIHPVVLVAVAVLAVGYGVYEYRHDLANRLHQLRSHRAARRSARS